MILGPALALLALLLIVSELEKPGEESLPHGPDAFVSAVVHLPFRASEIPMKIGRCVLSPFLLSLYPVIALYAQNVNRTPASQVVWPIVLATMAAVLVWWALRLAIRDAARAGLLMVVIVTFFNTTSLVSTWVDDFLHNLTWLWVIQDVHVWPPLVLVSELALAVAFGYVALFRLRSPELWISRLNLLALFLILMPICSLVMTHAGEPAAAAEPPKTVGAPPRNPSGAAVPGKRPERVTTIAKSDHRPDIYYIILDGYARTDVMFDLFDFDNKPFLERLERKGFYIARRSTSNYCQTPLSLSSALNAVYLNGLIPPTSHEVSQVGEWIANGAVVQTLRGLGYQFVTFATGFNETDHPEADVYLSPSPYLSPFHHLLLARTPLNWLLPDPGVRDAYIGTRERTMYLLTTVPRIARWRQPTFTFAHILSPHPPFVFGSSGEDVSPHERLYYLNDGELFRAYYGSSRDYAAGYRKQAMFLTNQVESMIIGILANSPEPPIIILQSDHGSGMRLDTKSVNRTDLHERMSILNAYYLPGRGSEHLYPNISPVNSFRVVFNAYFGANLDLLPDRSYYSSWDDPFLFIDVTEKVRPAQTPSGAVPGALSHQGIGGPAINTPSHAGPLADLRPREAGM
jgi:hypothetical protein